MSLYFSNKNGTTRIASETTMNAIDNYVPPGYFAVTGLTYLGSAATPSGSLSTGNGIINANNTAATHRVYAFGITNTPTSPPGGAYSTNTYTINYKLGGPTTINVLAVGGGGGGAYYGGGAGAGGVVMTPVNLPGGTGSITISVGAGGIGRGAGGSGNFTNCCGNNTTVTFSANAASNIVAGGGAGGGSDADGTTYTLYGSGGGQCVQTVNATSANALTPNGIPVYANNGGSGHAGTSGGGGGAGTAGAYGVGANANGGSGIKCTLPGITDFTPSGYSAFGNYFWGGGGGGTVLTTLGGSGGLGGGGGGTPNSGTGGSAGTGGITTGTAGSNSNGTGGNGGANTGGGGGGAWNGGGGSGGSGIVVIAFPISSATSTIPFALNSDPNLYIYYTFQSGTYTGNTITNVATSTADAGFYNTGSFTSIAGTTAIGTATTTISNATLLGSSYFFNNGTNYFIHRTVTTTIGTGGYTLSFWFYYVSGNCLLIQIGGSAATGPGIYHETFSGGIITLSSASAGYGPPEPATYNVSANTNVWVHKTYTISASNCISIYHNGVLTASTLNLAPRRSYPFDSTAYTYGFLFGNGYTSSTTGGYTSTGTMSARYADIRVYTRALSPAEVAYLYLYRY
jgi:hypothetical protein